MGFVEVQTVGEFGAEEGVDKKDGAGVLEVGEEALSDL